MKREYQICTRCVMDIDDLDIVFDEKSICNYCIEYYKNAGDLIKNSEAGEIELE